MSAILEFFHQASSPIEAKPQSSQQNVDAISKEFEQVLAATVLSTDETESGKKNMGKSVFVPNKESLFPPTNTNSSDFLSNVNQTRESIKQTIDTKKILIGSVEIPSTLDEKSFLEKNSAPQTDVQLTNQPQNLFTQNLIQVFQAPTELIGTNTVFEANVLPSIEAPQNEVGVNPVVDQLQVINSIPNLTKESNIVSSGDNIELLISPESNETAKFSFVSTKHFSAVNPSNSKQEGIVSQGQEFGNLSFNNKSVLSSNIETVSKPEKVIIEDILVNGKTTSIGNEEVRDLSIQNTSKNFFIQTETETISHLKKIEAINTSSVKIIPTIVEKQDNVLIKTATPNLQQSTASNLQKDIAQTSIDGENQNANLPLLELLENKGNEKNSSNVKTIVSKENQIKSISANNNQAKIQNAQQSSKNVIEPRNPKVENEHNLTLQKINTESKATPNTVSVKSSLQNSLTKTRPENNVVKSIVKPILAQENEPSFTKNVNKDLNTSITQSFDKELKGLQVNQQSQSQQPSLSKPLTLQNEVQPRYSDALSDQWTKQVIDNINKSSLVRVTDQNSEIRLRLHPEHLGELLVNVKSENGKMTANIVVNNIEVKKALETNMPVLNDAFISRGIEMKKVDIYDQQEQRQSSQDSNNQQFEQHQNQRSFDEEKAKRFARYFGYNTREYTA